ncbi:hypothetical protein KL912_000684 [Ogataea haglerorum]|nr:hypothetical protein KL912_000684 [Ogataea haglerorum]
MTEIALAPFAILSTPQELRSASIAHTKLLQATIPIRSSQPFSCVCDVNIAAGGRLYINAIAVLPRDYHRENLQTRAELMHRHCRPNAGYKGQGDGADLFHSVIIGDICWIAANATTLSGVAPDDHSL